MKMNFVRFLVAIALLTGTATGASAQFGNLLNKAKEKVQQGTTDTRRKQAVTSDPNHPIPVGEKDVEVLFPEDNSQYGVWHPETRVFDMINTNAQTKSQYAYVSYSFPEDGRVMFLNPDGSDPRQVGVIRDGVLNSAYLEGLQIDENDKLFYEGDEIGNVLERKWLYFYSKQLAYACKPMDPAVLAFMCYNMTLGKNYIDKYKPVMEAAIAERRKQIEELQNRPAQPDGGSASGHHASYLDVSGSEVRALDASRRAIGRASRVGGDIYIYNGTGGSMSTGVIRKTSNGYTINFRGRSNEFRVDKVGETLDFKGSNGLSVGSVRHNGAMRRYEVLGSGSTAPIAEFPDSIDPAFAAMLFYNFFD